MIPVHIVMSVTLVNLSHVTSLTPVTVTLCIPTDTTSGVIISILLLHLFSVLIYTTRFNLYFLKYARTHSHTAAICWCSPLSGYVHMRTYIWHSFSKIDFSNILILIDDGWN